MREVRRVRARAAVFEEQPDLFSRQRPLPHLHHADFAIGEVAAEVRRGTSHFENVAFLIRLGEVRLLRDLFPIEPQLRAAAADAQHGGVRLAVVHFRTGVDRAKPADVIDESAAANEERLRIWRPLALARALREQGALTIRFKSHHRREVCAEIKARIHEVLRTRLRQRRHILRPTHELVTTPHTEHGRAIRWMLHGNVVRPLGIERDRQVITELHLGSAIEMQTIIERPLRRIER